jgi:hypothetical protein
MKQKLKLLLAYFRAFKTESFTSYISFDFNDYKSFGVWDESFITQGGKVVKLPTKLQEIFEDIIKQYIPKFHRENNYDESDWWELMVYIFPNQNRINFRSECMVINEYDQQRRIYLKNPTDVLSREINVLVNTIFEEHIQEEDNFEYDFNGSYDVVAVDIDFDYYVDDDEQFIDLADKLMAKIIDKFWADSHGAYGKIYVKKDNFVDINYFLKSGEYEMTEMDINVTPNNIEE